jgi:rfaE bifunctional protein kinase chain/domain
MSSILASIRLDELLGSFSTLRIGLLGDLFLDRYLEIDGAITERSIETGLDAYQVDRVRNQPGALGTVINNLAALEVGRLVPVTVLGEDGHGDDLVRAMQSLPVDLSRVIRSPERLTPTYTKPLLREPGGGVRELHRLDVRSRCPLSVALQDQILERLRAEFARCDGWIVMDQMPEEQWGVVTREIRDELARLAAADPEKLILIDSRSRLSEFRFGSLKGNRAEVLRAAGYTEPSEERHVCDAARKLAERTGQVCYCTLGEEGILVAAPDQAPSHVPGYPVLGPVDIVGAGDSATSGLVSSLLAGASWREAAVVANLIASITVQQIGTTGVATPDQVRDRLRSSPPGTGHFD